MKVILFLMLFSWVFNTNPAQVPIGADIKEVSLKYPAYNFKFYKVIEQPIECSFKMTFGMLGYWEDNKGVVLNFTNDRLVSRVNFNIKSEYIQYITNPMESKNIIYLSNNLKE